MKWHFYHFQGVTVWFVSPLPPATLRRRESQSFLSVQCSTCMCVSFVHVWCLLKCVNSDNTPTAHPVVAEISQSGASGAGKPGRRRDTLRKKKEEIVWNIPCRKEVHIGTDTMQKPTENNFTLKRRFCCVQL